MCWWKSKRRIAQEKEMQDYLKRKQNASSELFDLLELDKSKKYTYEEILVLTLKRINDVKRKD